MPLKEDTRSFIRWWARLEHSVWEQKENEYNRFSGDQQLVSGGIYVAFRLLPYTVSKAACQIIHSARLHFLLPRCHTPPSPTVVLSNSLLISSQPFFYLLPLFSSVAVTNIFHFLKVIRRSQLTGVVQAGEGRTSSVSHSLPLQASKKITLQKLGLVLWPLEVSV